MRLRRQEMPRTKIHCTSALRAGFLALTMVLTVQGESEGQGIFSAGEILRYKVRWAFIRLGTVEIQQRCPDPNAPDLRQFALSVKSAPALPFINLDFTHTATAGLDPIELKAVTIDTRTGDRPKTTYQIERAKAQLIVIDSCQGEQTLCDTIQIAERCYEALTLLLMARSHAATAETIVLPTVVGGAVGETVLEFTGRTEEIGVPALDDPVEAFHFTGDARWVGSGFGGMKGKFKGWISRDEAAVPLRAEVAIFLGSVVLELESIERPHWDPLDTASSGVIPLR